MTNLRRALLGLTLLAATAVAYNNCGSPGMTFRSYGGSTVGNPLAPATYALLNAVCGALSRCNGQVSLDNCRAGLMTVAGIGPVIGLPQNFSGDFTSLIQSEQTGVIGGSSTLDSCVSDLTALSCQTPQLQSAYDPATMSYSGVTTLLSSQSSACGAALAATDSNYNGILSVKAYGDAPGAPAGTPNTRQVSITWLAFKNASAGTSYALVRAAKGLPLDGSATTACTSGTAASCRVCSTGGAGPQTCTDTNIAATPQQYDYAVFDSSRTAALPARITVPVPPANMILVQRDAATYEMCQILGKTSDPLNHQRCAYSGLGAAPFNTNPGKSALNLPPGYYDFGYNLFVDRWTGACNWTPASSGGKCNALLDHTTSGDCFGSGAPSASTGSAGNVYYDTQDGYCYVFDGASWVETKAATPSQKAAMYTIDPSAGGGHRPPLAQLNATAGFALCQAISDPNYGAKRVPRRREFVAFAAAPWLSGEPGALNDAQIDVLESSTGTSTSHVANHNCNSDEAAGVCPANFASSECAGNTGGTVAGFVIGSQGTSACVSRFGVQDFAGNMIQLASDQIKCDPSTNICRGQTSTFDGGNTDMSGFNFDGAQGPGGTAITSWAFSAGAFGALNFSPPLALPLVGNDGGYALGAASFGKFHGDTFDLESNYSSNVRSVWLGGDYNQLSYGAASASGRWSAWWRYDIGAFGHTTGVRCVLPAE